MKFIKLHSHETGTPIHVNAEAIDLMVPGQDEKGDHTQLHFRAPGLRFAYVKENPEEIIALAS